MHTSDANQITNRRATEAREAPVVANDRRTWIALEPRREPPRDDRINPRAGRSESVAIGWDGAVGALAFCGGVR